MNTRDIVMIGTSAGGLDALTKVLPALLADMHAAVFVVMHVPANPPSILHTILQTRTRWPVLPAVEGASVRHGIITVAVSDHHLLFRDNRVRLARGPRENRSRPSIDATFRSGAVHFGARCIGVVLTGSLDDGTAGLWAIKDRGGVAVVQSPDDAEYPSMPVSALSHVQVDHTATLMELPDVLAELVRQPAVQPQKSAAAGALAVEDRIAAGDNALEAGVMGLGTPSSSTCPHCHGVLMEVSGVGPLRFRCHTGHVFSPASLLVDLDASIDESLWSVMRAIEERQMLLEQLIESARVAGNELAAQEYARQAEDAKMRADEIRGLVMTLPPAAVSAA